jgi:hypothetical protein
VIATLKDGSKVYGLFGSGSRVSSDPGERDIYLSHTFVQGEKKNDWVIVPDTAGVYIRQDEIRTLEFINFKQSSKQEKV